MLKLRCFLLLGSLLLISCSDDPVQPPPPPLAAVVVTELTTGEPLLGVKVVAMNATSNTVLGGPQLTDAAGRITFDFAPDQNTRYLVFGGLDWEIHHQSDWTTTETATRIILRAATPHDGLPRIAGTVVDATTGAPLDRVFIGVSPQLIAYTGATDPGADVTGPDGTFLVQEIAFGTDPITGNLTQIDLLFVSRVGYRPRSWAYHHANGDNNLDITGTEITLTPIAAEDTGVLSGRVLLNGLPEGGVPVGLGGVSRAKSGFGIPGQVAQTDESGQFTFNNLATGFYVVHPGFGLRDGYFSLTQARPSSFAVTAGKTTEAGDQQILWEIVPALGDNATVSRETGSLLLSWSPLAAAFVYQLSIDGEVAQTSFSNQLVWEIPADMPAGWHSWRVLAETESHNLLGVMQKASFWCLTDQ